MCTVTYAGIFDPELHTLRLRRRFPVGRSDGDHSGDRAAGCGVRILLDQRFNDGFQPPTTIGMDVPLHRLHFGTTGCQQYQALPDIREFRLPLPTRPVPAAISAA